MKDHTADSAQDALALKSTRVSNILILATLTTYLAVGGICAWLRDWRTVGTVGAGSLLLVLPLVLLRAGRMRLGNTILMVLVLTTVAGLATVGQGIRDLSLVAIPVIYVYVGLTLDRTMLRLCYGLTIVALVWLAFGEPLGLYTPAPLRDPYNLFHFSVLALLLLVAVASVDLLSSSLRRTVNRTQREITDRRDAEQSLRASEAKFRAVVENSHDGILFVDAESRISYRSPSYRRINGYAEEDRLGRSGFETVHPDDVALVRRYWRTVLEQPSMARKGEYRILHRDGSWRWVETSGLNLLENPDVRSVVVITRDISERKQAEHALRASEERFRVMFERHAAVMLLIDPQTGSILDANDAAAEFYGWPRDRLKRMRIQEINTLPPEAVTSSMADARVSARTRFNFRHRRSDGSVRDVEVFSSRIPVDGRDVLYSLIHDVTERVRAEELLRQGEERYRLMFESAPVAITITRGTEIVYANPACLRLFGYASFQELRKVPPLSLFDLEWRPVIEANIHRRARGLAVPDNYEAVCLRKDGTRLPVLMYFTRTAFTDGPATVGFIVDLAERKRYEDEKARLQEQLVQAQKMESVGRLAGGVAHDFNNMLGVILGHAEIALQQVDASHSLRDALEEIREAAVRSADLTRQLLAFARRQTVTPRVLDLNDTVRGMLNMLRRMIGEEVRLEWKPQAELWPIRVDPSQIDQMLANLCVNARDAIRGVGTIGIRTGNRLLGADYGQANPGSKPGEYVLLEVTDTGSGMDKETLAHLFEPFFTTKSVGEGTGLGLATVYGAVRQNAGFIEVQSEPAKGTTFSIYLPRHCGTGTEADQAATASLHRGRETILLVEDEPSVLRLTAKMLELQGYTVLPAHSPAEGLRLAAECAGQIHLLLTDVVMPEMNGRELAEALLQRRPNLKCLYMSGYTADVISHHGVLDGGVSFIHKPFTIQDLSGRIRQTLEGS